MYEGLSRERISVGERGFILSKVLQILTLCFAHWQASKISKADLDSAFRELSEKALGDITRVEFSLLMYEFFARLNNGHTQYRDPLIENCDDIGVNIDRIGGRFLALGGRVPGLVRGDAIVSINGRDIRDWYAEMHKYLYGSTEHGKLGRFTQMLRVFLPAKYTLCYEDRQGGCHTVEVDRTEFARQDEEDRETSQAKGAEEQVAFSTGRWITEGETAYIKIPSFMRSEYEKSAIELVDRFSTAKCLMVDVRGNGGGSTPLRLANKLQNKPYGYGSETSPMNMAISLARGPRGIRDFSDMSTYSTWPTSTPSEGSFGGHLIVLADRVTGSAAEDFLMLMKSNGRALIVGETTTGSTGQPMMQGFDNGIGFCVGTVRTTMPDGSPFEGVGIEPDVYVALTREDLYEDRDPVMLRAVDTAGKLIAG